MLPLFLESLALAMVTSCPFWPCVFMFTHLGINACPLHLLLLNFLSAHSSATQSSCGFLFPSLFTTCIFRTCLQFIPHWPFITHVDDLPTHFIVHNNLVSPSAALYHDNHSQTNAAILVSLVRSKLFWLSCFSELLLVDLPPSITCTMYILMPT